MTVANFNCHLPSLPNYDINIYDKIVIKGAETNLYTFRYWLLFESIQICFRTLYFTFQENQFQSFPPNRDLS